jgi:hypothetical protein
MLVSKILSCFDNKRKRFFCPIPRNYSLDARVEVKGIAGWILAEMEYEALENKIRTDSSRKAGLLRGAAARQLTPRDWL